MEDREVTTEELKVNALLERIAQLENDKADLRVMVTVLSQRTQQLEEENRELREIDAAFEEAEPLADDTANVS